MNNVLKDVISEIAEALPALVPSEPPPGKDLPVDDPAFPNDLEPVIRAEDVVTAPVQQPGQDQPEAATPMESGSGA